MTRFKLILALGFTVFLAGCLNQPGGGNQNDNDNGTPQELTQAQQKAVAATSQSIADCSAALAGASPSAAAPDMVEPQQAVTCPQFSLQLANGSISLSLDYGEGCTPVFIPASVVSGSVTGSLQILPGTASLVFDQFSIDDRSINGSINGMVGRDTTTSTFDVQVDLAFQDGAFIEGSLNAVLDRSINVLTVSDAALDVGDGTGEQFDATWTDLVIELPGNSLRRPMSGSATAVITDPDVTPSTVTVDVEFTEQTPVDGTVLVSINGGDPFSYTPPAG